MDKLVVVINGAAEIGKDSLVKEIQRHLKENNIAVFNVSSIDYIKNVAFEHLEWDGVKDDKGRKLLSELKRITTEYNDLSMNRCNNSYKTFMEFPGEEKRVLFLHIREYKEIERFKKDKNNVITVLIDTHRNVKNVKGNLSDDDVYNHNSDYDFIIYNDDFKKAVKDLKLVLNKKLK